MSSEDVPESKRSSPSCGPAPQEGPVNAGNRRRPDQHAEHMSVTCPLRPGESIDWRVDLERVEKVGVNFSQLLVWIILPGNDPVKDNSLKSVSCEDHLSLLSERQHVIDSN